jgi:23S rRNA (cytidine2498-2'-O)-methyltransferase
VIVVAYCRAGFEAETALDFARIAEHAGGSARAEVASGSGYVVSHLGAVDSRNLRAAADALPPFFARDWFVVRGPFALLPADSVPTSAGASSGTRRADRVTPLLEAITPYGSVFASVWVEYPDTNDGKELSSLARALEQRLTSALDVAALAEADPPPASRHDARHASTAPARLRIFLADGATAFVGRASVRDARWRMGIPRLSMPGQAPSRSTLKLAEAFAVFLGDDTASLVRAGTRAVDLGAAPGGWTWQLAHRGLQVTAVDNGPLKGSVADDPLVTHLRADGLTYRPRKNVDWMVCDIAEQPARIATLVADWIADGVARRCIFNLKLPMKKRYEEVLRCVERIDARLARSSVEAKLTLRQLYHDREEITGYLNRVA